MAFSRRMLYGGATLLLISLYVINILQIQISNKTVVMEKSLSSSLSKGDQPKQFNHNFNTDLEKIETPPPKFCPGVSECPPDHTSYTLESGYGLEIFPFICIGGENITARSKSAGRGINVVVIDGSLRTILSENTFDTYSNKFACYDFVEYASSEIPANSYVFIASHDDFTSALCKQGKQMLILMGSTKIETIKFRQTYIFIGRKGAPKATVEQVGVSDPSSKDKVNAPFGVQLKSHGCLEKIRKVFPKVDPPPLPDLPDCGINCAYDEVSIYVSSGYQSRNRPKLCVGNEYIFGPQLKGGRGFNLAVVCPYSKNIVKQMHFDAFQRETSPIDTFLLDIPEGFLLVGVTHDDVYTSLGNYTRSLFREFGITEIDTMKLRSVMYFAGRKGLKSSRFQGVAHVNEGSSWPKPINKQFCLPLVVKDEDSESKALTRKTFCEKNDGYFKFCFGDNKLSRIKFYEPWSALPHSGFDNSIYDVPIVLLASFNKEAVAEALNTLSVQPGIKKDNVFIAYPSIFDKDYKVISDLFFGNHSYLPIPAFSRYHLFLEGAFKAAWATTKGDYLIVIDEDILPSKSFQFFFGQMLHSLKTGKASVVGASNENTFTFMTGSVSKIQYIDHFPTSAFMLTREFYNKEMRGKCQQCCSSRSWQGWFPSGFSKDYNFAIPEVSRAVYFDPDSYFRHRTNPNHMFAAQLISSEPTRLTVPSKAEFVEEFKSGMAAAKTMASNPFFSICDIGTQISDKLKFILNFNKEGDVALFYPQKEARDVENLGQYYSCLNLTRGLELTPFSTHHGMTRVSFNHRYLYIAGVKTVL